MLEQTPKSRYQDLVFLQNGMLEPWFQQKGLQVGCMGVMRYLTLDNVGA